MADAFGESLRLFVDKLDARMMAVFHGVTEEVHRSVVEGSPITGAPGQPVDTGTLKGSWIPEFTSETTWQTGVPSASPAAGYARPIEEGIGPHGELTLRSKVGGFHSVALTRAGFDLIVEQVRNRVVGSG